MTVTGDAQEWVDFHHQPSGSMFNLLHAFGCTRDHTPLPIIIDAVMSPQMCTEGTLALHQIVKERAKVLTPHFFNQAQRRVAPLSVPFVWDAMNMNIQNAQQQSSGTERKPLYEGTNREDLSSLMDS
jgi:hypothetical protein